MSRRIEDQLKSEGHRTAENIVRFVRWGEPRLAVIEAKMFATVVESAVAHLTPAEVAAARAELQDDTWVV